MKSCISCGEQVPNPTTFKCPKCGSEIVRCNHCKEMAIKYKCKCGFEGP